jgi:peptidoglycan/LPS O-acetylase OafA/YrhL
MHAPAHEPHERRGNDAGGPHDAAGYLPSLDGLRALGVSMVLGAHVGEGFSDVSDSAVVRALVAVSRTGPAGVDLFFVLSGFLITGILLASRGEPRYFRSFYARRTLRIFPLYYTYLALLPVVLALIPSAHEALRSYGRSWPWYALYLTNLKILFFYDRDIGSVHHLWSLAVEEQFYLLWPLVVAALPRRGLTLFVVASLLLAPLVRGVWSAHGGEPIEIYMSSWTHADGLLVGAGIAILRTDATRWHALGRWILPVFCASLVGLLITRAAFGEALADHPLYARAGHFSLLAALFGAVLVYCVRSDERGQPLRMLCNAPIRQIGARSYGIYVYHFLLLRLLGAPLEALFGRGAFGLLSTLLGIALASYALAELSFRFIERPALRLKRFFPRPHAGEARPQ